MVTPLLLIVVAATSMGAATPQSQINVERVRFSVTKRVLSNGLTVLVHEDHTVPTISYQTWFRVGSKNEEPGFTGIAHLFEHMMFKGAKKYSGKDFDRVLQANGVTSNAFTTYDYTGYFEDLPSGKLELIMDVESDRIENLQLTPENLVSEKEVVKEERRFRVDNSLDGVLNENLWSKAFHVHPYKWPVIGWMKDIDAITLERCKSFFHTYYSVSNAVVAIVGDVNTDQALVLVDKYYGRLPKVEIPPLKLSQEPPQEKEIRESLDRMAQSERLAIGFHIGKEGDPDSYVLDLVNNILSEGESSRLYKKLVYEQQKALNVGSSAYTPQDPGLFQIFVELKPGIKSTEAEGPILKELEKLSAEKVSENELTKAKNQVMNQWVDSMKTVHGKARNLILNEVVTGNYANTFDDLVKYNQITRDDILRVSKKYFKTSNMTAIALIPKKGLPK